jgi:SAM-dependent methyltransferase
MAVDRAHSRRAVRTAVVLELVTDALAGLAAVRDVVQVLDIGGGTGGIAVPLAQVGYGVTVIDPSPDALAGLERRAADTGTSHLVTGRQGDATEVVELLGTDSVDAVVCHSVLEVVDDPDDALSTIAAVLRPGGIISILVANRAAAVVARVGAGRLAEARVMLADPAGRGGPGDPLARRFTLGQVEQLVRDAGLQPMSTHGIHVFADAAPAALLDGDPQALDDLVALERAAAADPAYAAIATQLHVLARRR